jgi:NADP-dependent 3-hydroxy acid dehydrogenase YdfG
MRPELQTAIITGASSGVGAATAFALSDLGLDLALIARREERLNDLAQRLADRGGHAITVAADLSEAETAQSAIRQALEELGSCDVLVSCIGTNIPQRRLDRLSIPDWHHVLATNLSSIYYCVHTVLPSMRERGSGLIISISSIAGIWPSVLSGAVYCASKAGLNALSACINLEERENGIRSCVICPGDIDTEIMGKRPQPPSEEARQRMLQPEDVAELVAEVIRQPERALVEQIVVRPASHMR